SFFFQAEEGIRDFHVTGVQTCALPIFGAPMGVEPRKTTLSSARTRPRMAGAARSWTTALAPETSPMLVKPSASAATRARGSVGATASAALATATPATDRTSAAGVTSLRRATVRAPATEPALIVA